MKEMARELLTLFAFWDRGLQGRIVMRIIHVGDRILSVLALAISVSLVSPSAASQSHLSEHFSPVSPQARAQSTATDETWLTTQITELRSPSSIGRESINQAMIIGRSRGRQSPLAVGRAGLVDAWAWKVKAAQFFELSSGKRRFKRC